MGENNCFESVLVGCSRDGIITSMSFVHLDIWAWELQIWGSSTLWTRILQSWQSVDLLACISTRIILWWRNKLARSWQRTRNCCYEFELRIHFGVFNHRIINTKFFLEASQHMEGNWEIDVCSLHCKLHTTQILLNPRELLTNISVFHKHCLIYFDEDGFKS